jgi:hypothetical protein
MKPATLETSHPTKFQVFTLFRRLSLSRKSQKTNTSLPSWISPPQERKWESLSHHMWLAYPQHKQHYASKVKSISLSLQTLLHQHRARRVAVDVSSSLEPRSRIRFQDTLEILEYFVLYEVSILNGMVSWSRGSSALLRGYIALVLGFLLHLGMLGLWRRKSNMAWSICYIGCHYLLYCMFYSIPRLDHPSLRAQAKRMN